MPDTRIWRLATTVFSIRACGIPPHDTPDVEASVRFAPLRFAKERVALVRLVSESCAPDKSVSAKVDSGKSGARRGGANEVVIRQDRSTEFRIGEVSAGQVRVCEVHDECNWITICG